jgi:hypothetical protein
MNQWIDKFFELVSREWLGRKYKCLTCSYVFWAKDCTELSDKAVEHLKGKCRR